MRNGYFPWILKSYLKFYLEMCSRHSKLHTKPALIKKSSSLSATILDYYNKYGQNRDLEKYLRVQRSRSKSSSEGSLLNAEIKASNEKIDDSLDASDEQKSKEGEQQQATGVKSKEKTSGKSVSDSNIDQIKIQKTTSQQLQKKTKSKSYSFNTESNIEIIFPPEFCMPKFGTEERLSTAAPVESNQSKMLSDSGNQTDNSTVERGLDPIDEKNITLPDTPRREVDDTPNVEVSPTSSIASNKVRLEWDSLADIGYKIVDMTTEGSSNMSPHEKSALVKFFAKRGLTFDDNLVIFATPDKRSNKVGGSIVDRSKLKENIHERWKRTAEQQLPNVKGLSPASNKRLWEKALTKYRQKYGKPKSVPYLKEIDPSFELTTPQCQSTPITTSIGMPKQVVAKETKDACENTDFEKNNLNISTQTSFISVETKGIQVEGGLFLKFREGESETSAGSSKSSIEKESASLASFEFCLPHEYSKRNVKESIEPLPIAEVEEDDHVPSLEQQIENLELNENNITEDKENVPPADCQEIIFPENDKENIRPAVSNDVSMGSMVDHVENQPVNISRRDSQEPSVSSALSNESILPEDLQKAVEMLNILVATRQIDETTKKKLMRRVVKRLLKDRYSNEYVSRKAFAERTTDEGKNNSTGEGQESLPNSSNGEKGSSIKNMSGVEALSSSNATPRNLEAENEQKETEDAKTDNEQVISDDQPTIREKLQCNMVAEAKNENDDAAVKSWLEPMTYSEIQFMNQKMQNNKDKCKEPQLDDLIYENQENKKDKNDVYSTKDIKDIRKLYEQQKQEHAGWIDREIERLKNLKIQLNESQRNAKHAAVNDRIEYRRVKSQDVIYSNADKADTIGDTSNSSRSIELFTKASMSTLSNQDGNQGNQNSPDSFTRVSDLTEWDSHLNMKNIVKNRTKMETPSSDNSIQSYAKAKRNEFMNKYAKKIENIYSNSKVILCDDFQPPIYTKPYSAEPYCQPRRAHIKTLSKQTINVDAYTSITGSNGFLSSNSISIAFPGNSTSNTTTHQYDNKASVGVQTTDTLTKTKPILQVKNAKEPASTIRVNRLTNNKQQQVRPQPLAYVITFLEKPEKGDQTPKESPGEENNSGKETENHLYGRISSSSGSVTSHRLAQVVNKLQKSSMRPTRNKEIMSSSSQDTTEATGSDEQLTLQEYLQRERPEFCAHAEERRNCVNELHNLRRKRNEQRKKLFVLNNSTNTLNTNMKKLLPPPPLAQTRLFTSKVLKERTRRRYQNLPEVRQKKCAEKENKIRRSHRIAADIFNKNLQWRVLKGKTDLSNSMTLQHS